MIGWKCVYIAGGGIALEHERKEEKGLGVELSCQLGATLPLATGVFNIV